jgi:hypothetical protein
VSIVCWIYIAYVLLLVCFALGLPQHTPLTILQVNYSGEF